MFSEKNSLLIQCEVSDSGERWPTVETHSQHVKYQRFGLLMHCISGLCELLQDQYTQKIFNQNLVWLNLVPGHLTCTL